MSPLVYAHIGDLHLTESGADNARDLAAIVAELAAFGDAIDFVYLPGDNADNGCLERYQLADRLLAPLAVPVHAIPGDHDVEGGSLAPFHALLCATALPYAVEAAGVRCLFLDMSGPGRGGPDFRLGAPQRDWLAAEVSAAARCAVFMHSYPADLVDAAEREATNAAIASPSVLLVDMGHTHYNEIGNDGDTIFAATRSTGQVEEGPVGYALVAIDGRTVSWRFRPLGLGGPTVLVTAPADRRLATDPNDIDHAPAGRRCAVRASVLATQPVVSCTCSIDGGEPVAMTAEAPGRYGLTFDLPAAARLLRVEARTDDGAAGSETVEIAAPADFARERRRDGSDADRIGAWPERGILGTQLGPNRNGRQW